MQHSSDARRVTPLAMIPILAFLAGALNWILRDATVWPWDQAWYGEVTVQLARMRHGDLATWIQANLAAFGSKPPLLAWIGQFFTPLIQVFGTVEPALLTANLVFAGLSFLLLAQIAAKLKCGPLQQCIAILVMGGSSLYIGSTNQYFVETLQALNVCMLMRVSFGFERRPLPISASLLLGGLALAMLAKASSFTFAAPLLFYCILTLFSGQRTPSRSSRVPAVLLFGASAVLAAACACWYYLNWQSMAQHFRAATSSEIALAYGSISSLDVKLAFWVVSLGKALAPWPVVGWGLLAMIVTAMVVEIVRTLKLPMRLWLRDSVNNGLLFALALIGTVVSTVVGLALQINEETRFLAPLLPMIAILAAWALNVLRRQALTAIVLVCASVNGAVGIAYANQFNPLNVSPSVWLKPYNASEADRRLLQSAVGSSCTAERPNRYVIVGVEYPSLNANSAAFFSEIAMIKRGYRCYYTSVGYTESNIEAAITRVDTLQAEHIVTVRPEAQSQADGFNLVAKTFAERIRSRADFQMIPSTNGNLLIVERKRP